MLNKYSNYYHELSYTSQFVIEYYVTLRNEDWGVEIEVRSGEKHVQYSHVPGKREPNPEGFLVLCGSSKRLVLQMHSVRLKAFKIKGSSCLQELVGSKNRCKQIHTHIYTHTQIGDIIENFKEDCFIFRSSKSERSFCL